MSMMATRMETWDALAVGNESDIIPKGLQVSQFQAGDVVL